MNRGSGSEAGIQDDPAQASMRPRFMNRGSAIRRVQRPCQAFGFNEAPIHESGKCDSLAPSIGTPQLLQ